MTQEEMFGRITQNFMALMERSIKAQEVANQLKVLEIELMEEINNSNCTNGGFIEGFAKTAQELVK